MIRTPFLILVAASVIGLSWAVSSTAVMIEAADDSSLKEKKSAPRYSETCPHGHNGFNCPPSSYKAGINELDERVTVLENHN